jgi:hypothetical protein
MQEPTSRNANSVERTGRYPIARLGNGNAGHHFFGYYNKSPWDAQGRRVLAHRVHVLQAELGPHFAAQVGCFELRGDGFFRAFGETTTWNFQMGCQLQWLENTRSSVIYNTRCFEPKAIYPDFASTILDVDNGQSRRLPLPVYVVASSGEYALCISYDRLQQAHPTIGYLPHTSRAPLTLAPADDGIRRMDVASGEHALIISLRQLRDFQPVASMERAFHWVTHLEIAPGSARFLFLHRWTECFEDETRWLHRLLTADADGGNLTLLECGDHPLPPLPEPGAPKAGIFDYEKATWQISHPAWRDDRQIIVWGPHHAQAHYHLYTDRSDTVEVIGQGVLTENGHMTYSPDGRWILSDTYPDETDHRLLIAFDTASGKLHELARLYTDPALGKVNRCDLHPRWSRDGRQVCIDSVHERERQMYVVDAGGLCAGR